VSPEAVAVNVTDVPTVPALGPDTVTDRADPPTTIVADAVAVFALESVAVTVTVYVPLAVNVVVKLEPVPDDGLAPGAVHVKV
jgi:hypothetical protein